MPLSGFMIPKQKKNITKEMVPINDKYRTNRPRIYLIYYEQTIKLTIQNEF